MFVYVVEFWSNKTYNNMGPHKETSHVVQSDCYYGSTLKKAIAWCKKHKDYGGSYGMIYYFPWHFRIVRHTLDIDETDLFPSECKQNPNLDYKLMCALNPSGTKRIVK